ncbi:MAG TPA: exodeoxyribonuclease VII large subunit [Steroidobacteraceae bacterium]|nr:exodeoxyribonuclease VII large subunit [Steroidobacteraceae bacterium]
MPPSTQAGAEPERNVYTVSRLNREVRVLLERGLAVLWVQGELSNLSVPASGHWYFSLKDRNSQLRCAMFRQRNMAAGFTPKAGQQVLARGRVSLYEPRGEFQFIVDHLEEAGVGALKAQFERVKAKLAGEGLFAAERKRALPRFPRRIGVITSPTGAAIRDILHILSRRFPPAAVLIYPTPVQGAAAAASLVASLDLASARRECDVLILARGGGSLEDLWCFNDERVARAIHASAIPVVSGIGHEIDFTIADFVADARAPTPSGAAELVAPDRHACLEALTRTLERLSACMRRELRAVRSRFDGAGLRLKLAHPGVRLNQQQQRLDDLEQRLTGAVRGALHSDRVRISEMFTRLLHESPAHAVREFRLRHEALAARLSHSMTECLSRAQHRFDIATRTLDTVSPLATLSRGFAVVRRVADGKLLTDADRVAVGEDIEAQLAHGLLRARVTQKGSS